jgi:hypothetical protein
VEYHSEYKKFLFSKREIFSLLESTGFPLDDEIVTADIEMSERGTVTSDWMKLYAAKGALRLYEAAWILSGEEPPSTCPKYYYIDVEEQWRYLQVFEDLAVTGEIAMIKRTDLHQGNKSNTWLLDHKSILKWCKQAGYEWPLEILMNPSDDASQELPESGGSVGQYGDRDETSSLELLSLYNHQSDGLRYLKEVIEEFWFTYDPNDPGTIPSATEVKQYLIGQGASGRLAEAVDRVCRPSDLQKTGLKQYRNGGR